MTVVTETGKNYSTVVCGTHVLVLRTSVESVDFSIYDTLRVRCVSIYI